MPNNPTDNWHDQFEDWQEKEAQAEAMIPLIGKLYREQGVVLNIYGRKLVRESAIGILKAHRYARQITNQELSVENSYPILKAMTKMNLEPARVDLGKLTTAFIASNQDASVFLEQQLLAAYPKESAFRATQQDIVLYGFGRIGRLLARILVERTGGKHGLHLRAIVVRPGKANDLEKRASLLRRDSVHGSFQGTIKVDEANNALIINGSVVKLIYAASPDAIDYSSYGINNAIVIDNTGKWRDEEGLGLHLKSQGVAKVLLTAPGKGNLKNIVYGVNHKSVNPEDKIVSAASCTTNAITPVLKVINDAYGVEHGHIETIHAYTNDQNLIDNYHDKERRGRSAALNMVITETGAAKAVAKALPELAGKLTGNAIRVPTPNVSLAILNLNLNKEVTKEELNTFLRNVSLNSALKEQIDYTSSAEIVSSDLVGSVRTGVVDARATIAEAKRCTLYVWYDNEAGYSYQVVRLTQILAGIELPSLPV